MNNFFVCKREGMPKPEGCRWEIHDGDLFDLCDGSLCHCVSKDLAMGAGIAVTFKQKFGGVAELRAQNPEIGKCLFLKRNDRYVYYLVTKRKYSDKPTPDAMTRAIRALREMVDEHGVEELWMPKIGCGLDRLSWDSFVFPELKRAFRDWGGKIHVINYVKKKKAVEKKDVSQ